MPCLERQHPEKGTLRLCKIRQALTGRTSWAYGKICDGCDSKTPSAIVARACVADAERQLTDERADRHAAPELLLATIETHAGKAKADAVKAEAERKGIIKAKEIVKEAADGV